MKFGPTAKGPAERLPRTAVIVEHPRLIVMESSEVVDPGGLEDALELIVTWAIRVQRRADPILAQAPTLPNYPGCSPGEST